MSTLLDSLRRVQDVETRGAAHPPTRQVDTVLSSLGYARRQRRPARSGGWFWVIAVVAVMAVVIWSRAGSDPETMQADLAPRALEPALDATPTRSVTPTPDPDPGPDADADPPAREAGLTAVDTGTIAADAPLASSGAVEPAPAPEPEPTTPPDAPALPEPRTLDAPTDAGSSELEPTVPERFAAALEHQRAGDTGAAEREYRSLVADGLAGAQVHNNLGLLYQAADRLDAAAQEFEQAIAVDARHSKARNNLGVVRMRQGHAAEAAAIFREAVRRDAGNLDAWVNLGLALDAVGDQMEARRTLLAALEIDGRHGPAHYNLARLFELAGDRERAVAHYGRFLEHGGPAHAHLAESVRARVAALDASATRR